MGAPRLTFWRGLAALTAATLILSGCSLLAEQEDETDSEEAVSETHVCDPIDEGSLQGYADELGVTGPTHTHIQTFGATMPMIQTMPTCAVQLTRDTDGPTLRWGVRDPEVAPKPTTAAGFEALAATSVDAETLELTVQVAADGDDSIETTEIVAQALGFETQGADQNAYGVALTFEVDGLEYVTMAHRLPADVDRTAMQNVVTDMAGLVLRNSGGVAPEPVALDDRCPTIDGPLGEHFSTASMNAQSGWLSRENQLSCFYADDVHSVELETTLPVEHARFPEIGPPISGWDFMLEGDHGALLYWWENQPGVAIVETQIGSRCIMSATILRTGSDLTEGGPIDEEPAVTALQVMADSDLCASPEEEAPDTPGAE